MNTQLKFDPQGQPNFQLDHSDLRSRYERVAWDSLPSIWRHMRLSALLAGSGMAVLRDRRDAKRQLTVGYQPNPQ
jgi:hypothetical protein